MDLRQITEDTLLKVSEAILSGTKDGTLRKALPALSADPNALTGYNLEAPAKQLVALLSPFRAMIPRTTRAGAVASTWKQISALSLPKPTTAESAAGAAFTTTISNKTASYKVLGVRGQVTREAVAASQGFDPALAKETANTLLLAMKLEDMYMLGGNVTALATPGATTVTEVESIAGATIPAQANIAVVAALTLPAANRVTLTTIADYDGTNAIADGTAVAVVDVGSDGVTVAGAEGNVTTTGAANSLRITWAAVPGASAYAVYVGLVTGAANLKCEGIFTQTSITLRSLAATGQAASALTGTSADALSYDGIVPQLVAGGSGAYVKNLIGKLSQSGGEIVELQDAFASIYRSAKLGKFMVLTSGIEARTITKLGIGAGGGPTIFVDPNANVRSQLMQGYHVGAIINGTTGDVCPVYTLPWLMPGTILILATEIPYPDSNTPAPFDMAMGYDWERWDYASTTTTGPVYPFEVRCYGVLRAVFTGGCGIIYNVYKS